MVLNLLAAAWAVVAVPQAQGAAGAQPERTGIEAAATALDALDTGRLESDRAYAQATLGQVELLLPTVRGDESRGLYLLTVRAFLLDTLGRRPEALEVLRSMLTARPATADAYLQIFRAASSVRDPASMVESIEGVARTLGQGDPASVFELLSPQRVYGLNQVLREQGLEAERVRLAEALIAMGWQRGDPQKLDVFRRLLIDRALADGHRDRARQFAREISHPDTFITLLIRKQYDGLITDGPALLRQKLEEEDRGTASMLAALPNDTEAVLARVEVLRGAGRNDEVVALLRPWLADVPAAVGRGRYGSYIVNQGADALIALHREGEALAAMRALAAIPDDDHPGVDLIGPSINYTGMLWATGRWADSLAEIERLRPRAARSANEFGRLWVASHVVCADVGLNRRAEAEAALASLRAGAALNPQALSQALLCLNDLDAVERLMIERLGSAEPNSALLALQDYAVRTPAGSVTDTLRARLRTVRERPAVRAAIDRVGRVLTLPLDQTYQGGF